MKKILLLSTFSFMILLGFSQSQRFVLLEEFTSATCGPCVSKNTQFHTWQTQNPDKFTSIYYHVNWPAAGDPMNLANPGEVSVRVNYYMPASSHYVPYSVLDGNYYNGSAGGWSMTTVNTRYAMPSPFEIQVQHSVNAAQDTVFSTMLVKCTQAISASLAAHNVIIEKWIHFNSAPCASSNGERDFYNVMKKMLPGSSGTTLPTAMAVGDYVLLEGVWPVGEVYDFTQIASVGFVQDKTTKEIYQTANSAATAPNMPYGTDLQVLDVVNIPSKTCMNHISPAVMIRNNGNNTITSMTIKYKINDGSWSSYTWNGSVGTLQKTVVTLPEYVYPIQPANVLTIYSTNPNNTSDQYPKNDTLNFTFTPSPLSTNQVKVAIRTDNNPQETTWAIKNSADVTIASGGPYTEANKLQTQMVTLPQADCYSFTIYDSGKDGICCSNGNGGYEISSNGSSLKTGGAFGASERSEFWLEAPVGNNELALSPILTVSPNPFDGSAKVTFSTKNRSDVQLKLFNSIGMVVSERVLGTMEAGQHETTLSSENLKPGIYILNLTAGKEVSSVKVTIIR